MGGRFRIALFFLFMAMVIISCQKNNDNPGIVTPPGFKLSYGDSIFYLRNQASDYIVTPTQKIAGQYSGFPEGIDIDVNTGAVNVTKSETGLRYKITFYPAGSLDSFSTTILISGINFLDGFYKLNSADSILKPIYNANNAISIPGTNNNIFDEGSNCNGSGCTVNVSNGEINLAQTVRNGVFGATPSNNDRHEFQMNYRISDNSNKSLNTLKVKLYYFDSMKDVTQEVYDIISSRQGTILKANLSGIPLVTNAANNSNGSTTVEGINASINVNSINSSTTANNINGLTMVDGINRSTAVNKAAKPRPPCIFILAR